jgi:hypothetical protein
MTIKNIDWELLRSEVRIAQKNAYANDFKFASLNGSCLK